MRVRREGKWRDLSYRELAERVHAASVGLRELGIRNGDRVGILSENRPEWAIADYACLVARCTDVPIYPTLPARQAEYNYQNQFELPVLFYVLMILLLITRKADYVMVMLAWIFVALRNVQ